MFVFRIEVYTSKLLITGNYALPFYRQLNDALNDHPDPYITLLDVIISPLEHPQQAQRINRLLVERSNMLLMTVLHEPARPADYEEPAQPTNREVVPVMFLTDAFALQAQFVKRPDWSVKEALAQQSEQGEDFLPLHEARVMPFQGGSRSSVRSFACLGRAHIQALYELADVLPADPARAS
jgi:hypothetical protein